jgi:hypothetical protein
VELPTLKRQSLGLKINISIFFIVSRNHQGQGTFLFFFVVKRLLLIRRMKFYLKKKSGISIVIRSPLARNIIKTICFFRVIIPFKVVRHC